MANHKLSNFTDQEYLELVEHLRRCARLTRSDFITLLTIKAIDHIVDSHELLPDDVDLVPTITWRKEF